MDNGSNTWPRTDFIIPDPKAYDKGRASNGPVWSEFMQGLSGGKVSHVYNYAYVDAFACNQLEYFSKFYPAGTTPPALGNQTDMYLAQRSTLIKGTKNVAVVWAGANDITSVLLASNQTAAGTLLVTCLLNNLAKLALSGETHVVAFSLPPLDLSPYALGTFPPTIRALIKYAISQLNGGLALGLQSLTAQLPQTQFYLYDAEAFVRGTIVNATASGLVITNTSCVTGTPFGQSTLYGAVNPNVTTTICPAKGKGYFFWDWLHPTTDQHAILAADVSRTFKAWGLY